MIKIDNGRIVNGENSGNVGLGEALMGLRLVLTRKSIDSLLSKMKFDLLFL